MEGELDMSLGGNVPWIVMWDDEGKWIGAGGGGYGPNGSPVTFRANHNETVGYPQAKYLAVSATGDDAICIAFISVAWPDGQKRMWLGDVG